MARSAPARESAASSAPAMMAPPAVEKFEVAGKDAPDARTEAIDMLTPKLEQPIDGVESGGDRRYTRESRWSALLRARNGWSHILT